MEKSANRLAWEFIRGQCWTGITDLGRSFEPSQGNLQNHLK